MPATYEPISRTIVSGNSTNTINLSSFGGYTDLIMTCTGTQTGSVGYFFIRFNNNTDTGNYGELRSLAYSGGRLSDQASTAGYFDATIGNDSAKTGSLKFIFPQYTDTNSWKYANMWQSDAGGGVNHQTNFYAGGPAALTSIQLFTPASNFFADGFVVALYGLLAA
jgi:hypothetical protein